jgi:hypothetical protein
MKLFIFFLNLLLITISGYTQESDVGLYRTNNGEVSFISDAPLELISAQSNELMGIIDPYKQTFAFQLDIRTLKGFNSSLQQEHFYENYMETDKYEKASFSGKIIEKIDFEKNAEYTIRAKGILDIHGVKQERIIKCALVVEDDMLIASAVFMVSLVDHDISIPKLVYQKIAEMIKVEIRAELYKVKVD